MAVKQKKVFYCVNCGCEYPKWQGVCNACGEWNTIEEHIKTLDRGNRAVGTVTPITTVKPLKLSDIDCNEDKRIDLLDQEFNRVLGGGLVPGAFVLLGGEPGIGKSTLILQTVLRLNKYKTLYVSGEESPAQLKMRSDRLGGNNDNCLIYCQTNLDLILSEADKINPDLIVIDSIQTIYTELSDSAPGSITQIRATAGELLKFSKTKSIPVIVIGHITKEGSIAGPKILEHTVDVVLQFDGDKHYMYRILRGQKNRFGSTAELGIYEMKGDGLRVVSNPSEHLIRNNDISMSGIAIAVAMEGVRPFLIETQALVSSAVYSTPQRSSTGFDIKRMNMLLAVLEKRAGFKLIQKDVFLNIAGGIKINDPATDLAVITSILSSGFDLAVHSKICFTGEVGLSGEVRPVNRIEQRIKEAERLGFSAIIVPKDNMTSLKTTDFNIKIVGVQTVEETFKLVFRKN